MLSTARLAEPTGLLPPELRRELLFAFGLLAPLLDLAFEPLLEADLDFGFEGLRDFDLADDDLPVDPFDEVRDLV